MELTLTGPTSLSKTGHVRIMYGTNYRELMSDRQIVYEVNSCYGLLRGADAQASRRACKVREKEKKIKELGFTHGKYTGNEQQLPALFVTEEDGTVSYAVKK